MVSENLLKNRFEEVISDPSNAELVKDLARYVALFNEFGDLLEEDSVVDDAEKAWLEFFYKLVDKVNKEVSV